MHGDVAGYGRSWLQGGVLGVGAEMPPIGKDGDRIGEPRGLW